METTFSYNPTESLNSLAHGLGFIIPEIIIASTFLISILTELVFGKRKPGLVPLVSALGVILTIFHIVVFWGTEFSNGLFLGMINTDGMAAIFKVMFLAGTLITIFTGYKSISIPKPAGEYFILLNGLLLGMMFMAMSRNLLMMYLSMEMVSLASYILTAYDLSKRKTAEAALKYFIYGAFASGIMIYAISWVYGITGTLDLAAPEFAIGLEAMGTLPALLIMVLLLAGFAFKIGAAPFHFWAPDVYEAAPWPVAAFFSIGPKIAGFAMLIRLMIYLKASLPMDLLNGVIILLAVLSITSMLIGNIAALRQDNLRRMIAYSSIAHAGTALLGVITLDAAGFSAVIFYLGIYFLMNFGLFLFAGFVEDEGGILEISALSGTAKFLGKEAVMVSVLLAGLVGLPPTAGFIGKLYVFIAVFGKTGDQSWYWILLGIAVLNTVISLFYYMKLPSGMVFRKFSGKKYFRLHSYQFVLIAIMAFPVVLLGVFGFDGLIGFILDQLPEMVVK